MKFRLGVFVLALAGLAAPALLWADEPPTERKSGKVLILPNQRTLEGAIERVGDRYRIRRQLGELWLPADKAVCLCGDWNEAFGYMASQANLLDPDERLRLGRWCQSNGLHDLALKQVEFALELRPKDAAARQLKILIEQSAQSVGRRSTEPIEAVSYTAPATLDVGVKSLAMFASRVQPILMNTCASCHVNAKETRFRLFRVTETSYRNSLENNLLSALAQIDVENPELSPLLNKAVSNHGGGKAPLAGRDSIPFQTLYAWVAQVIETNPHLRAQRTAKTAVQPREVAHVPQTSTAESIAAVKSDDKQVAQPPRPAPAPLTPLPATPLVPAAPATESGFAQSQRPSPSVTVMPAAAPAIDDPYSPDPFNAKMHPQGKKD